MHGRLVSLLLAIPTLLVLCSLAGPQEPASLSDSSLDRVAEIVFDSDDPVWVEHEVKFAGMLHSWTTSELDLVLRVESELGEVLGEDDDSGGGTTPYVGLAVEAGDRLRIALTRVDGKATGAASLHLIAAPETETTREAAQRGRLALSAAIAARATGETDRAITRLADALDDLCEAKGAEWSGEVAQALSKFGGPAYELGAFSVGCQALAFARAHCERTLPPDHPELVGILHDLSTTMLAGGDLFGARALLEGVVAARERTVSEGDPNLLRSRSMLASTMRMMGHLAEARALEEAVLETYERLVPADHSDLLQARANLALTLRRMDDYDGARLHQEAVLEAYERVGPEDHPNVLQARRHLATTLSRLGDLSRARELDEAVLEVYERTLPADHPNLLAVRNNLATTLVELGDLDRAREFSEAVLESYERTLPEGHPHLLAARANHAVTLKEMGDLLGARALEEVVLEAFERLLPEDDGDLLAIQNNLANTMRQLGDLAGARAVEEAALEVRERTLSEDHLDVIRARTNLAVTLGMMDDEDGARALLEAVLESCERTLTEEHPERLAARLNVAGALHEAGELAAARELFEAVLEDYERLVPEDHTDRLNTQTNLAAVLQDMGDLPGALELDEIVLAARERLLPEGHPQLLDARQSLAVTLREMGELDRAHELTGSLGTGMLRRLESISMLSSREVREVAGAETHRLSIVAALSDFTESEEPSALVYTLMETWRHAVSVPLPSSVAGDAELHDLRHRILETREQLNDLVAGGLPADRPQEEFRQQLQQLSADRDRLERELREHLIGRGALVIPIRHADVAASLARRAVAIGYRQLPGWQLDASSESSSRGDRMIAHVVRADGSIRAIDLGAAVEIENLIHAWRNALGEPIVRGGGVDEKRRGDERKAGEALRTRILDPLLDDLDEETIRLHVCLDASLHLVAFDALPLGEARVGDRWRVVNEVSFGRLVAPRAPSPNEPSLLALGGVAFDADVDGATRASTERGGVRSDFAPLLQTRLEVEAISSLFEEAFDRGAAVLTEAAATKAAFHELAPRARYLHLATHGWFAPESLPSALDVQAEEVPWRRASANDALEGLAPGTLCGVALAGANHGRDSLGRVPGIMTAEELAGVDLSACELAVLSACETNVGIRRAGQGIQSLQAAVHAAGARTTITTLWKVDDAATRRLMELFYTYLWAERVPKAEALWKAKRALRAEGHPVRAWGAWILSGAPG